MSKKESMSLAMSDFMKVKSLVEKGRLEAVLSKLNPDDVRGTLQSVPKEVVRFMTHFLLNMQDVEQKVRTLKPDQRIPVESLLESARRHRGEEFAKAFVKEAASDETIRREFGLTIAKTIDSVEAKIDNAVNSVRTCSQLMLKSRRLYTEISFMQNDVLLLRVNAEIDEALMLAAEVMDGVKSTFEWLAKNAKGVKPELYAELCKDHLDKIDNRSKDIRAALARANRSTRRTTMQTTPRRKREEA